MKKFSFRPTLTLSGRRFKGLRGWSGKPFHPPLTDIPIAAYLLSAGLDLASLLGGPERGWARETWHVTTWVLAAGLGFAVLAALTGLWDAKRSSKAGTQARRTINSHATIMLAATAVAAADFAVRVGRYDQDAATPPLIVVLSVLAALLVTLGATYGGALVFEYGFNVETAGDHAVWHESETDVFPGDNEATST